MSDLLLHQPEPPKRTINWHLLAFLVLVLMFIGSQTLPRYLADIRKSLGGRQVTAYVVAKELHRDGKFGYNHVIEVSYYDVEHTLQIADIDATTDTYNSLAERAPVQVIYAKDHPDKAYLVEGQGAPGWMRYTLYAAMIIVLPAVIPVFIARYPVLKKKVL